MAERAEPLGIGVEEPENVGGAFPRLTDAQLAKVRAAGTVRAVARARFSSARAISTTTSSSSSRAA